MQKLNALQRVVHFFRMLPSAFCILLVRLYQLVLSPAKNVLLGPSGYCRFEPSCSQYAIEAVKIHGVAAGSLLAAKRICRCHPWGEFGEDPVPSLKSKVQSPKSKVGNPRNALAEAHFARLNAARTAQRAVPTTPAGELRVSNVGIL